MDITFGLVWEIVWFIIKAMADVLLTISGFVVLGLVFYLILSLARKARKLRKNG